jgi:hypothetical protein
LVVGGVILVVLAGLLLWYHISTSPHVASTSAIDGVQCQDSTTFTNKDHIYLQILYQQTPVPVGANIGVRKSCSYWLNTEDNSGVIYAETPPQSTGTTFTLGQFFAVWGQPLSSSRVATISPGNGQQLRIWVNDKRYHGNPAGIKLRSHDVIVIQVGPPYQLPPPSYTWNKSRYPH